MTLLLVAAAAAAGLPVWLYARSRRRRRAEYAVYDVALQFFYADWGEPRLAETGKGLPQVLWERRRSRARFRFATGTGELSGRIPVSAFELEAAEPVFQRAELEITHRGEFCSLAGPLPSGEAWAEPLRENLKRLEPLGTMTVRMEGRQMVLEADGWLTDEPRLIRFLAGGFDLAEIFLKK